MAVSALLSMAAGCAHDSSDAVTLAYGGAADASPAETLLGGPTAGHAPARDAAQRAGKDANNLGQPEAGHAPARGAADAETAAGDQAVSGAAGDDPAQGALDSAGRAEPAVEPLPTKEAAAAQTGSSNTAAADSRDDRVDAVMALFTSPPGYGNCRELVRDMILEDRYLDLMAGVVIQPDGAGLQEALEQLVAQSAEAAARPESGEQPEVAPWVVSSESDLPDLLEALAECAPEFGMVAGGPGDGGGSSDPDAARTGGGADSLHPGVEHLPECAALVGALGRWLRVDRPASEDDCEEMVAEQMGRRLIAAGLPTPQAMCAAPIYLRAYLLVLEGAAAGSFDDAVLDGLAGAEAAMHQACGLDGDFDALRRAAPQPGLLG
ncbi:MAG: hypothetical protein F4Z64_15820 [Acidimicrobiaceae bacterium]|nr:hypothetical protein [Acidimicrobiaceae bacterium]MYE95986.1 hypothetical protein [Acidimicrobiaceae bacterium]